jgi:arylsulfatase A-like enzyme
MRALTWAAFTILTLAAPALAQHTDAPLSAPVVAALRDEPDARPHLVVVISIDQFRADYLTRLAGLFGEGGFKRLTSGGAWFVNAHHSHYPLTTAPGHAVLLTGTAPYKNGIIDNEWWDPVARRMVYAVEEPRSKVIGAAEKSKADPVGPKNLRSTTVGDELKLATAGRSRGVSIGLKDRAAILMGGHAADTCIWFDTAEGRWISSSSYCRQGALPGWVQTLNDEHIPTRSLGTSWTCALPDKLLAEHTLPPRLASKHLPKGFGEAFPHTVGADDKPANYAAFQYTPDANRFVLLTAERAVVGERLGQRGVPDLLTINLATNDFIGHTFGPYSPEAVDLMVRTDRMLADFLLFLDDKVGPGRTLVIVTGDHGVSPIPEDVSIPQMNVNAVRVKPKLIAALIADALTAHFGPPAGGSWFSLPEDPKKSETPDGGTFIDGAVYLSREAVEPLLASGRVGSRRDFEQAACDAVNASGMPGIYACFGKHQVLEGRVADNDLRRHLAMGVHPQLSADLFILQDQLCLAGDGSTNVTSHSTPYAYDTHVPVILYQPGLITPGVFAQRVSPMDIAPTISLLLGIELPSGCDGNPLIPALTK